MTDRERTIHELCRFYEEGLCSSPETPKRTNECIKGDCVVFEGYTRQSEPEKLSGAEILGDGSYLDEPNPLLDKLLGSQSEPSEKSVEAVADKIGELCCGKHKWHNLESYTDGEYWRENVYPVARSILKFCQPELTAKKSPKNNGYKHYDYGGG